MKEFLKLFPFIFTRLFDIFHHPRCPIFFFFLSRKKKKMLNYISQTFFGWIKYRLRQFGSFSTFFRFFKVKFGLKTTKILLKFKLFFLFQSTLGRKRRRVSTMFNNRHKKSPQSFSAEIYPQMFGIRGNILFCGFLLIFTIRRGQEQPSLSRIFLILRLSSSFLHLPILITSSCPSLLTFLSTNNDGRNAQTNNLFLL